MDSPLAAHPFVAWMRRTQARHSYWLTRFLILRLLGFVYFAAFVSLAVQVLPLLGSQGLTPAQDYLVHLTKQIGSPAEGFLTLPSVFWFGISDAALVTLAWLGVALSLVVALGYANLPLMALLWALYSSFVNLGQEWYGYGWEFQLLETGFLALFLCPLLDGRPFPKRPPPVLILWLYRWLAFRIMLGAGLIKLRGDACWRDLTCLDFHYETQPIPNPLSRWFHFHPWWMHRAGTAWNHVVELLVPWFAFGPRPARHVAGVLLVTFQLFLILSGNLSFLNYLTIIPMLACFDDSLLARVLPKALVARAQRAAENNPPTPVQETFSVLYVLVVALLSIAPMLNLVSSKQVMNGSFDRLHLVNTYGAFGAVGRQRYEIIFEGTMDEHPSELSVWRAYEFPFKPGDPTRTPGVIAPFQPRLDWAIWFAAMAGPEQYPWTLHFTWKLLHNDEGTLSLLANNPFPGDPPRAIRAQLYRYHFAQPGNAAGRYWDRELMGTWLPPLTVSNPVWQQTQAAFGWPK